MLAVFVVYVVYFSMLKHEWRVPTSIFDTTKNSATVIPFEGKYTINLPEKVVSRVRLFVLFVGYPRSGHSIIASAFLMLTQVLSWHMSSMFLGGFVKPT